jgi:hypothetical protein
LAVFRTYPVFRTYRCSVQQSEFHECVILLPEDIGQGDHGAEFDSCLHIARTARQSVRLNVLLPLEMVTRVV